MGVDENDFNILFSSSWWQALFSCFKKQLHDMILIRGGGGGGVTKVILILEPFDGS